MVQCRNISIVPWITQELGSGRRQRAECLKEGLRRLVSQGPNSIRSCVRIDLLPIPPQAVEIGVVEEEERIANRGGDIGHRPANTEMPAAVRIAKVAIEGYDSIIRVKTDVDVWFVPQKERIIVEGARHAAVVGKELKAGVIVAQVDGQIRKRPVIDAFVPLATKARDRVEQNTRCESAHVEGLFPVRLVPCVVAFIAQGILVSQHDVTMPREEVANIMDPFWCLLVTLGKPNQRTPRVFITKASIFFLLLFFKVNGVLRLRVWISWAMENSSQRFCASGWPTFGGERIKQSSASI